MTKLSERVRPNVEAAPWVIAEIEALEIEIQRLTADAKRYQSGRSHHETTNQDLLKVALLVIDTATIETPMELLCAAQQAVEKASSNA